VVACCVQVLPVFLAFCEGIVSPLVLGTMLVSEVLVLQSYSECTEVYSVVRKWVSSGFVFVFVDDTMCFSCCILCCCYCCYLCSGNCCVIGIGVDVIACLVAWVVGWVVVVFDVPLVLSPTRCGWSIGIVVGVVCACDMSIVVSYVCEWACCLVVGFAFIVCAAVDVVVGGAASFLGVSQRKYVAFLVLPQHFEGCPG
jgi:hypothetical protein